MAVGRRQSAGAGGRRQLAKAVSHSPCRSSFLLSHPPTASCSCSCLLLLSPRLLPTASCLLLLPPCSFPAGWIFILSHGWPPLGYQQAGWRFCHKCSSLFFDGYTDNKGVCANGAGHEAAGFQFILTSNTAPPWIQSQQPGWKCCQKCFALFFDGYEDNKGLCPASGRHEPSEDWHLILNHHQ